MNTRSPIPEELRLTLPDWYGLENGRPENALEKLREIERIVPSRPGMLTGLTAMVALGAAGGAVAKREGGLGRLPLPRRSLLTGAMAVAAFAAMDVGKAMASSNFIWYGGTSNNGLLTNALTLLAGTSELDGLASAAVIVSSVSGASGVFTNSNTAQAIWADLFFSIGSPGMTGTLSAGANLAGWFLTTPDQSTYESATVAPPRGPDWIVPVPSATNPAALSFYRSQNVVRMPALEFKVMAQNNMGQAVGSGTTTAPYLKMAPYAVQY